MEIVCATRAPGVRAVILKQRCGFLVEVAVRLELGWYKASGGVDAQAGVDMLRGKRGHLA